jgi:ATP-binding cassette subfamily B multidrug efflux pump
MMKVFIDLMWYFKKEKRRYSFGILLLALVSLLSLVPPKVIGIIVDHIEQDTLTNELLMKWIGILLAMAITIYVLRFFWRIMIFGASIHLARLLRNRLYTHFTNMSPQFYQKRRIGDLMAHSTNDLQAIQQTAGAGVLTLVDSLTMGGFVLITMAATISWKLTLISLIPMPFMAIATSKYGSMLHKRFHKAQAAFSTLNDKVQESISGVRVIKAFGQEKHDVDSFKKQSDDVVEKNIAVAKVDALFDPTISLIVGLSFFLAVVFGSKYVVQGELTIGELVAFTTYLGLLIWPMLAFGWLFNIVERGRASLDRVTNLLDVKSEIAQKETTMDEIAHGTISYHINSFTYPDEEQIRLQNIHFDLDQGKTLGIVGKTGSGKSSLCKLLLREFDVTDGFVSIGNTNVNDYSFSSLRSAIGYVPQDHFLFSATIADNIAFAEPEASFQHIVHAAKIAAINEDILQFAEGYETVVGERGVTLSGGQKQRISIARAMITDPEILILDDSLSAVDAKTEEQILKELKQNREGKTTIITAHRLSAVAHADLILVLDQGSIAQHGTHDQLMAKDGWYKMMYQRQQLESMVAQGGKQNEAN